MTDSHDPLQPDPLDDLASAHLDGQTTDAEAARIAADLSLAERVAGMAAVRAAVGSDGPAVDEGRLEASIAAALAAFDEASADGTGTGAGGTLTPITAASARRGVSRRTLQLVGAVAVAVLLALFVPLLGRLDSDPSEDLATSAVDDAAPDASQRDAKDGDSAAGAAGSEAPSAESYTLAADSPVELGTFDDVDSLEQAVRLLPSPAMAADQAGPTTIVEATAEAAVACTDAPGATPPDAGPRELTGTATLGDRPVLVFVYARTTGERTVVVVDASDCTVVSSRTL